MLSEWMEVVWAVTRLEVGPSCRDGGGHNRRRWEGGPLAPGRTGGTSGKLSP